jgi:hypothetical protein
MFDFFFEVWVILDWLNEIEIRMITLCMHQILHFI